MRILATVFGITIAAAGVVGIAVPALIEQLGRAVLTQTSIYIIAALRVCIGIVLVVVAANSRTPAILRVLGILVIAAGLVTPALGVARSVEMLDFLSAQGPWAIRALLCIPVAFGAFVVYAVSSPRAR